VDGRRLAVTRLTFRPTESGDQSGLLNLAWDQSLELWPDEAPFDPGVHRHVVRFVRVDDRFVVCKELPDHLVLREYRLLNELRAQGLPVVTPLGTVVDRTDANGEPLEGVLLTRLLSYAIPYRRLFTGPSSSVLRQRLVDSLALLLTRLHLAGFFWGDCSLNNALFRRDAGELRAYVVDTETGELHAQLSDGQRTMDIDIAVENFAGGLLDMQAGGSLPGDTDPIETAHSLARRYEEMWAAVTRVEVIGEDELWRMQRRLGELRQLGFDANEIEVVAGGDGQVRLRPTDVQEGHHRRRLANLVGIEAHENQARRLLNDIATYTSWLGKGTGKPVPEAIGAYHWLVDRWEPVAVEAAKVGSVEPAEFFHEVLEHCWFLSERAGRDVGLGFAAADYVTNVLPKGRA
jgi:tRNA A-37 threonylcarbamoyl transferase component Bud32